MKADDYISPQVITPAYPSGSVIHKGLTARDYIAIEAMNGMVAQAVEEEVKEKSFQWR